MKLGNKMADSIGVSQYVWKINFAFSPMLYELDCHWYSFLGG